MADDLDRTFDVDLFVIGGGSGGVRAARIAAGYGARVRLAEEYRVGGTCVIRGCVPKKLMVYAGRFRDEFEDAAGFGWEVGTPRFDWARLKERRDAEITRLEAIYDTNLQRSGVEIVRDRAVIEDPHTVRLVASEELPAGMALLDAPDIDSVVSANRGLSRQLLSAADLWLFVTTAARYADAVPWDLLRQAADRGTAVAIVLDRVPREAMGDIREHLTDMLREQGLGTSPVFTVPESELEENGLLPDEAIARLRGWLSALASDTRARSIVIRQTLSGALSSLDVRVDELVAAARLQQTEAETLRSTADTAYAAAEEGVRKGVADGQLLRGEVLARWQEYVGTGEFLKKIESGVAKLRDRLTSAVKGQPAAQQNLDEALHSGVAELILAHADDAAATTARTWRGTEAGEAVIARHPDLTRSSTELPPRVDRMIREWQGELLDLIRAEGGNRRTNARIAAYGVNGIGLFLMLIVFSHTAGLTGAEIGIAGGTTVLAQKVLEAVFGDQAVREMAAKGRRLLLEHVADLYDAEQARYGKAIDEVAVNDRQVRKLENAVAAVKEAS